VAAEAAPGLALRFERRVDAFPIADSTGRTYGFPALGGLDRPRPQLVDIDGDGDLDLFVQEFPGRMMFFERVGAEGGRPARYVWRSDRWQGLEVGEWSRFVDVDGDGDIDLLAESPYSYIRWWRNDGGPRAARFTIGADSVRDVEGRPIPADRQNIPQLADLDCNGRLDLFLGRVDGTVSRFEMRSLDPKTGPRFALLTDRFENIQIIGGEAAPLPGERPAVPGMTGPPGAPPPPGPSLHGANTMAVVDVDQDGDQDILWGDFFEAGLLWIRNTGTCAAPSMRETPVPFPEGAPIRTSGYNAPAVADVDGDRDLDVLLGVIGGAYNPTATSRDNLYLLEQTAPGTYAVRTSRFLDGLDVGSESSPALADLDGDGDLDLVVGNKLEPDDRRGGVLHLFRNTGTARSPSFRAAGRIDVAPGFQLAPAFGDLDGDGDLDLVLGSWRDEVMLYVNEGSRTEPRFAPAPSLLVQLTRGSHTAPALADLDGDGDLDLLVGEASGSLNFYRNAGSRTAARFELVSDEWQGIRAGRRSVPRLADLDGDGDQDLVVGTEAGRPVIARNDGTPTAPRFARNAAVDAGVAAAFDWPPFSAPAFADLDADGDTDLLLGNGSGGVGYWENRAR
jgi:hypothetical protein